MAWSASRHYLNQCLNTVDSNIKFQWNLIRNSPILIQENAFENVVWKMGTILYNTLRPSDAYMRQWTWSFYVQIVDCSISDTKPLSEHIIGNKLQSIINQISNTFFQKMYLEVSSAWQQPSWFEVLLGDPLIPARVNSDKNVGRLSYGW